MIILSSALKVGVNVNTLGRLEISGNLHKIHRAMTTILQVLGSVPMLMGTLSSHVAFLIGVWDCKRNLSNNKFSLAFSLSPGVNFSGLAGKVPLLLAERREGSSVHFNAFTTSVLKDIGNSKEACMPSSEIDSDPFHTKVLPRF